MYAKLPGSIINYESKIRFFSSKIKAIENIQGLKRDTGYFQVQYFSK